MQDNATDDQNTETEWAEHRTDWAEDRTILANERTFAGWMRTGMASIAIAVGLKAVFGAAEPTWLPKSVSMIFIVAALLIFWSAWRNAGKAQNRLNAHNAECQPTRTFAILSTIFSIGSVIIGVVLWML